MMSILETQNLCFAYKDGDSFRTILNDVNVSFEKGKFYTILGVSGSGKTTFLSLISALDTPQKGKILFNGKDIQSIGLNEYRRKDIALIFQSYNLIPYLTAKENVTLAMGIALQKNKVDEKLAYEYLNKVEIDQMKANRRINHLSGGEQQRVAIARALSSNVDVIMADEPTGNLDYASSKNIVEIFKKLAHEENKCVIVVTHSFDVANESDVILRLDTSIQNFVIEK